MKSARPTGVDEGEFLVAFPGLPHALEAQLAQRGDRLKGCLRTKLVPAVMEFDTDDMDLPCAVPERRRVEQLVFRSLNIDLQQVNLVLADDAENLVQVNQLDFDSIASDMI